LRRGLVVTLLSAAVSTHAWGGPIMIGPLRLDLGPRVRVASVTLTNEGPETLNYQAKVETWSQSAAMPNTAPTDDIIVSPPISALPPGKAQIFRVALRHPLPPGAERGYRVILTDVTPPPPPNAGPPQINFRIAQSLPLFVQTAPGGKPALAVGACPSGDPGQLCVHIQNEGDLHTLVRKVTFKSGDWTAGIAPNAVLLAGGGQPFTIVCPKALPKDARIAVTVDAEGASVSGTIEGPGL
jgi:fimbrial chaperone protein